MFFSMARPSRIATGSSTATSSTGVPVTCGSINAKGSTFTLFSSLPFPASTLFLELVADSLADYLVDIMIGPPGAEFPLVGNLLLSAGKQDVGAKFFFPIAVPSGVRLSARGQSSNANNQIIYVKASISAADPLIEARSSRVVTYGATTADSGGAGIDPGATANTKGAWAEVTASTSANTGAMVVAIGSQGNPAMSDAHWLVDVGIGASGVETPILENLHVASNIQGDTVLPPVHGPYFVYIPAGTRISARCQCSITDATDRLLDVVVYGVCL